MARNTLGALLESGSRMLAGNKPVDRNINDVERLWKGCYYRLCRRNKGKSLQRRANKAFSSVK